MTRTSSVGKETLAYCGSCKMDFYHVIVAMQGDRVIRAQCRTCKKEHGYRAPKGVSDPSAQIMKKERTATERATKKAADSGSPIEIEWEKLMSSHKNVPIKAYSTKTSFNAGDRVNHPTFGDGVVSKLIHPNKVEIVFRTDLKVLIHAGTVLPH